MDGNIGGGGGGFDPCECIVSKFSREIVDCNLDFQLEFIANESRACNGSFDGYATQCSNDMHGYRMPYWSM